ncbi:hypothetical protein IGL98_000961 [Enterococcus sp. DIV0840]|uniref:hypothetical protein n=1 Tax=unclassified Enterococcus TaxID=2608891 RepID=UPI001A8FE15B|nr:hypothetical protein [Enterococcus sp. DIV0849a]MBO0433642.1 hypothetical protein [Enterococcus sp. DIV0849a]
MNVTNLDSFLKGGFITIVSAVVIGMIMKHWKGAEWLKIGSTILIALVVMDFANNQGKTVLGLVKWITSLFGVNFK